MKFKVLVAEPDEISRKLLEATLSNWGYEVAAACSGKEAKEILTSKEYPRLAIIDVSQPDMSGAELCKIIRKHETYYHIYILMLITKNRKDDIAEGLEAGADDYVFRPFDSNELKSRLKIGERIMELETTLKQKGRDLHKALDQVKELKNMITICSY